VSGIKQVELFWEKTKKGQKFSNQNVEKCQVVRESEKVENRCSKAFYQRSKCSRGQHPVAREKSRC